MILFMCFLFFKQETAYHMRINDWSSDVCSYDLIRYIESENDVVVDDELLSIWGNEFAKLTLKSGEEIGLIAIRDSLEYSQIANKISTASSDSSRDRKRVV